MSWLPRGLVGHIARLAKSLGLVKDSAERFIGAKIAATLAHQREPKRIQHGRRYWRKPGQAARSKLVRRFVCPTPSGRTWAVLAKERRDRRLAKRLAA